MTLAGTSSSGGGDEDRASVRWILVELAGVSMDLPAAHPEILLRESAAPFRELRIPVGVAEGTAIAYAFRRIDTPRPLTHELVTTIFSLHNVSIEGVRITARRGQNFLAELETTGPRGRQVVQCRPSDAIALAWRQPMPTPILVEEDVLAGLESA